MTLNSHIIIQQTVHGYDSGHKLMASSLRLPKTTQSIMSKMSDASLTGYGPSLKPYITGYPLSEIGAFAIAKTWPASEMHRPGCVWTHTLIIDYANLALIKDATSLLSLFDKPSVEELHKYKCELAYKPHYSDFHSDYLVYGSSISSIIFDIYNSAFNTIRYPSMDSAEEIALLLWGQQWPKLRRNFSFRTLVSKSSSTSEFDLAFTTENHSEKYKSTTPVKAQWLESTEVDLREPDKGLRGFLWRYGAACIKGRESFIPLVEVYNALNSNNKSERLNRAIHRSMEWSECPMTLFKHLLETAISEIDDCVDTNTINSILLIINKLGSDFNQITPVYKKLIEVVCQFKVNEISKLVNNNNEYSKAFIELIIEKLPMSKLETLLSLGDCDIKCVIRLRKDICLSSYYWKLHETISDDIIQLIDVNKICLNEILNAVLTAKNHKAVDSFISRYKKDAVVIILKEMCESKEFNNWARAVSFNEQYLNEAFTNFETLPIGLLNSVSSFIDQRAYVPRTESDIWISLIARSELSKINEYIDLSIFLFVRGFYSLSKTEALITLTLDTVIDNLSKQRLDYKQWGKIERIITPLSWWDWDKCEHTLNAVVNLFIREQIVIDKHSKITQSPILLKRVLKIYKRKKGDT